MDYDLTPVEFDEKSFSGKVRLFPLPGVSLYPGIVLPLHVFEERYQALVDDALDADGLIGMAVLEPGWETEYEGRPPIESALCIGRIVTYHRHADGRYNLFLAGVRRARVLRELEPPQAFRRAEVELLPETLHAKPEQISHEKARLSHAFRESLPIGALPAALERVFDDGAPLGLLSDLAAYALPLRPELKLELLAQPDAYLRAQSLSLTLEQDGGPRPLPPGNPPPFGEN